MNAHFPRTGNGTACGGFARRGYVLATRQIPLNEQTIFRTIEGSDELLHVIGARPQIIH